MFDKEGRYGREADEENTVLRNGANPPHRTKEQGDNGALPDLEKRLPGYPNSRHSTVALQQVTGENSVASGEPMPVSPVKERVPERNAVIAKEKRVRFASQAPTLSFDRFRNGTHPFLTFGRTLMEAQRSFGLPFYQLKPFRVLDDNGRVILHSRLTNSTATYEPLSQVPVGQLSAEEFKLVVGDSYTLPPLRGFEDESRVSHAYLAPGRTSHGQYPLSIDITEPPTTFKTEIVTSQIEQASNIFRSPPLDEKAELFIWLTGGQDTVRRALEIEHFKQFKDWA